MCVGVCMLPTQDPWWLLSQSAEAEEPTLRLGLTNCYCPAQRAGFLPVSSPLDAGWPGSLQRQTLSMACQPVEVGFWGPITVHFLLFPPVRKEGR